MTLPAPAHIHQLDGSKWGPYGCMGAAGAMALDAYSSGAIRVGMNDIHAHQSDQSGGIGLSDVAVAWRYYGQTFHQGNAAWSTILARLRAGDGVVITCNYGALGSWRAPGSKFAGAHALYLQRLTGSAALPYIVVDDPLRMSSTAIPATAVQYAYTGGAGWGQGTYAGGGTAAASSSSAALDSRARQLLQSAGVPSSPDSYVFTATDAANIARVLYGVDPAGATGKWVVGQWQGKTVGAWVGASSTGGDSLASSPLAGVAAALKDLPTTLARGGIIAGAVGLALVGVVLTFRQSSVVVMPAASRSTR